MAFSCKMNNVVNIPYYFINKLVVADISLDKCVIRIIFNPFKIFKVSAISKSIQIDYLIIRILIKHVMNEIASYESRSAGY